MPSQEGATLPKPVAGSGWVPSTLGATTSTAWTSSESSPSTALTALRKEREEVEDFLAERALGALSQASHEPQHRHQHVI